MKINYLYLSPVLMLLAACGGNASDANNDGDSAQSQEIDSFYTADRAFADLRGDVKQCIVVTSDMEPSGDSLRIAQDALSTTLTQIFDPNGYIAQVIREDVFMDQPVGKSVFTFEFDSVGNLTSSSTDLQGRFMVKRAKDGYVSSFTSIGSNGDTDYTKVYTWDGPKLMSQQIPSDHHPVREDGTPIVMPVDKTTYAYDENGYRISESEESGDPELQLNLTETNYVYSDFDEHGNWTKRSIQRVAKVYDIAPSRKRTLTDSVAAYQLETREIVYN